MAIPVSIEPPLVRELLASQFPHWADLPITPVQPQGWDNRTFRLGETLSARLPSAGRYMPQVEKEHRWLPVLAPQLPLPIPAPVARGRPGAGYPWPWSIYRWLVGRSVDGGNIADPVRLARDLAAFLLALQAIDASDGPAAGAHNFFRGGSLSIYHDETRGAIATLGDSIDASAAGAVWTAALASRWSGPPVWVHGDVSASNLLVEDGVLSAVIDFGSLGVGDPACDLTIAWTLFAGQSRDAFHAALPLDGATWARARGWALWKALITLVAHRDDDPPKAAGARRVIAEVLAEHARDTT